MTTAASRMPLTTFSSPGTLTADAPPELRGLRRDGVRLLVASGQGVEHTTFSRIGDHLRSGDLLVVNNSATVAGEVDAVLRGRGPIVVHVSTELDDGTWVVELRTAPDGARAVLDAVAGDVVELHGDRRRRPELLLESPYPEEGSSPTRAGNRLWRARGASGGGLPDHLARHGRPIAYGYLRGRYPLAAYQTVFGTIPGSAEMASAARPFTAELVTRLVSAGVVIAPITLHTGLSSQESGEAPQPERFAVPAATATLVNAVRARGGRVVAVGTTATRAIESVASPDGVVHAADGWTDLVITPDRPARVVRGLVTGWHDPDASHLLLVESVAGPGLTQHAYDVASHEGYAWHEFGDSCLFLPTV
ncbi:MAG TPA: S-adenosylmethionine:tRNA ribosyltransferase-isomerase [Dermatophilaceae bacterium]|nr:S-adenosylmethionine:tRNA ribosyltransferase-isomerase [Dermatophilaceae bacterium]